MMIRKIGTVSRTYRHMERYVEILTILFRYGFGELISGLKIEQYLDLGRRVFSGKLKIGFEHKGLEPLLTTLDRTSNRLAFAVVIAALIIGSSLIIHADIPPNGMTCRSLVLPATSLPALWASGFLFPS